MNHAGPWKSRVIFSISYWRFVTKVPKDVVFTPRSWRGKCFGALLANPNSNELWRRRRELRYIWRNRCVEVMQISFEERGLIVTCSRRDFVKASSASLICGRSLLYANT